MGDWALRRLLRDIARADDRWRLHEAWWNPNPVDWRAIVDDGDTGLWHTLDHFVDLVVRHPALPAGAPPTPHPWWNHHPPHDSGDLAWGELLAAAYPRCKLIHLQRTERDAECYQVYVIEERALTRDPGKPLLSPENWPYCGHWLDTSADWARCPPSPVSSPGAEAAVWVFGNDLTVEYASDTLAQYRAAYAPDGRTIREVTEPRLFDTRPPRRSPSRGYWPSSSGTRRCACPATDPGERVRPASARRHSSCWMTGARRTRSDQNLSPPACTA